MMQFSPAAVAELKEMASSTSLRRDMECVAQIRRERNSLVDADAYVDFVMQFNEFINHAPKAFVRMVDTDMRL
jgi:hypothetical protein